MTVACMAGVNNTTSPTGTRANTPILEQPRMDREPIAWATSQLQMDYTVHEAGRVHDEDGRAGNRPNGSNEVAGTAVTHPWMKHHIWTKAALSQVKDAL